MALFENHILPHKKNDTRTRFVAIRQRYKMHTLTIGFCDYTTFIICVFVVFFIQQFTEIRLEMLYLFLVNIGDLIVLRFLLISFLRS